MSTTEQAAAAFDAAASELRQAARALLKTNRRSTASANAALERALQLNQVAALLDEHRQRGATKRLGAR